MLDGFARKVDKGRDPRQPIALDILKKVIQALCNRSYEVHLYHAAFTTAFFGFMRVVEITAEAKERVQRLVLKRSDIKFLEKAQRRALEISFRFSKKQSKWFTTGHRLAQASQRNSVCPVTATQQFCDIRSATGASLFFYFDGSPVTRSQFGATLKRVVKFAGVAGSYFRSHSFRTGAASTAAMQAYRTGKFKKWVAGARPLLKLIFDSGFRLIQLGSTAYLTVSLFLLFCFL